MRAAVGSIFPNAISKEKCTDKMILLKYIPMNKKILNSVFKAYDIRGRYPGMRTSFPRKIGNLDHHRPSVEQLRIGSR